MKLYIDVIIRYLSYLVILWLGASVALFVSSICLIMYMVVTGVR